jgi:hypothetical protein
MAAGDTTVGPTPYWVGPLADCHTEKWLDFVSQTEKAKLRAKPLGARYTPGEQIATKNRRLLLRLVKCWVYLNKWFLEDRAMATFFMVQIVRATADRGCAR